MARAKRVMQQFVVEFPGPLPGEAPLVEARNLEEHLKFALECARENGCLTNDDELYYAKLDKLSVRNFGSKPTQKS